MNTPAIMNIIIYSSAENTSGGLRQALYLARGFEERGHTVLFFVSAKAALPALAPDAAFWRRYTDFADLRKKLEESMDAMHGPVVIHAFHNKGVKRAAWWGLFWRKKAVVVAHRGVIFRPNNPLPYWSPGIDGFLVNSQACAKVLRRMGVGKKRLFYVPNSIPDERLAVLRSRSEVRAGLGIPEEALVFLCIGGNSPNKGIANLMQAFADAFPPDGASPLPHLLVAGTTLDEYPALAKTLGIQSRAHCTGPTEDVGSLLAASDVFALPSLSESMPNTLLEAMRAGLPCIGTSVGAVPDILRPCGIVIPPGDVPALAGAMKKIAETPALQADLAAKTRIESDKYRPEKRLELAETIYTNLLQRKGLA